MAVVWTADGKCGPFIWTADGFPGIWFADGAYLPRNEFIERVIFAACASIFTNRLYPSVAPDNSVPAYAVQTIVTSVPANTLADGRVSTSIRVQIDTYDRTQYGARTLARQVTDALDALRAYQMGVTLQTEQADFESQTRLHRVMQEYSFFLPRDGGVS